MGAASGFVSGLHDPNATPAERQSDLAGLNEAFGQIRQSLKQIRGILAADADAVDHSCQLETACDDACDSLPESVHRWLNITRHLESPFQVGMNRHVLAHILSNLLVNAASQGAQTHRVIHVRIRADQAEGQQIAISVENDGPPIAPAVSQNLLSQPVVSQTGGNGVGLLLAAATLEPTAGP